MQVEIDFETPMPEMKEEEKTVSPVIMQYGGNIPTDAELQVRAVAFKRIQGVEDFFKNARREGASKR